MKRLVSLATWLATSIIVSALAGGTALGQERDAKAAIADKFAGLSAEDIHESAVPGLYEVAVGAEVAYISKDGRYLIRGDVVDLDNNVNITEKRRSAARAAAIDGVTKSEMIVFSPPEAVPVRHTVTVFTDIDCGYCRRFHQDIEQINELGIEVRYLFFPRSGPNQGAWRKAEAVWCAKDRRAALTAAKNGENVESKACDTSSVAAQYQLGEQVGLRGTPGVFTSSGQYIGGYLAPEELAKTLDHVEPVRAASR